MLATFKKRGDDMPMQGRILREGKGKYVVMINFTKTKRHYHDELVFAKDQKAVKAHIKLMYPTLTWRRK